MTELHHGAAAAWISVVLLLAAAHSSPPEVQAGPLNTTNRPPEFEKFIPRFQLTNGLTLGLSAIRLGGGTNTTEIPVGLLLKCPAGTRAVIYTPGDEYLARVHLYDSNHVALPPTEVGRKYGQKFSHLSHWDLKFARKPHGRPVMIEIGADWQYAGALPAVSELFNIPKPGLYRLEVEVQVMLLYWGKRQVRQITRFPPLTIQVVKP